MIFVASAIPCFVQVRRLIPRTKDDLDVPTTAVEFANRTGFEDFNRNVGDDEVPLTAEALGVAPGFPLFLSSFVCFTRGFFGHGGSRSRSYKSGLVWQSNIFHEKVVHLIEVFWGEVGAPAFPVVGLLHQD